MANNQDPSLATPQPAPLSDNPQPLPDNPHLSDKGAVPLPETVLTQRSEPGYIPRPLCAVADAIRYGDDREAAARGDHVHAGGWQGLLDQVLRDTAKELGCEPDNEVILETIHALKAAGRADAVPVSEALAIMQRAIDVADDHRMSEPRNLSIVTLRMDDANAVLSALASAPQQMTTQGEAVNYAHAIDQYVVLDGRPSRAEMAAWAKELRRLTGPQP